MAWSFLTGLIKLLHDLGLENRMENVQVCDLMCYYATFGELHIFKTPLV